MKLKKSIVFLLLFCLLFSNTIIVHATESMSLSVGSCDAAPGETVTIPILLNSNTGFVSMSLFVTYDTSALMLISYEDTGVIGGASHSSHFTSPYVLTWQNDTLTSNITSTGTIVYLTFLVSEDAKEQNYSIIVRIPTDGILDANGDTVSASSTMGTITVSAEHECSFGAWEYYSKTKHVRSCGDCDEREYKNHNWDDGEIVEEPSHDVEGEIKYTCEDCGATKTTEIDPEGHDWGDWMKLSNTQHKRTCSCGDTETEEHNWNSGAVTKQPTATESGIRTYTCEDCQTSKTESIAPNTISVTGVTLDKTSETLKIGDKISLIATVKPSNATNKNVTWSSSNSSIASVVNGVVTANKAGSATITATTEDGGFVATCIVTVIESEPDNIPVAGITLSKSAVTLKVGDRQWIEATVLPYDATNKLVNWTCSDLTIADIAWSGDNNERGLIVARSKGTAVITASTADGSFVAQCMVTVIDDNTPVDSNAPAISIDKVTSSAGKTVEVNIALKNNPGIASMKLKVSYDEAVLSLQNIRYNSSIGGQSQQPQTMASPVTLNWYNGGANSEGDFVYATLVFLVKDTALAGISSITATYDPEDVYNLDYTNVDFAVQNGQITIVDHIPGDISGDGSVNNKDLSLLFQYLSDWDVKVNEAALDVSGDGKVNNKDLSLLFQYLSDWEVEIH